MLRSRLRLALVAEEAAGVQVLHRLAQLDNAPDIVAVLTRSSDEGAGRPVVLEAAQKLGVEVWPSSSVGNPELGLRLREAGADLLVNVHSLFIIHPSVLAAPKIGSFNLHPGPLPEYAGLNVPSWAIYRGEAEHGVTLHWMDAGIDTGPIAWQARFPIEDADTGLALTAKSVRVGVPLVVRLATVAAEDPAAIPRIEQVLERRRYFSAGPPAEGRIDWSQTADRIVRFVRAADYAPFRSPWGHPTTELAGVEVGIAKAAKTGIASTQSPGVVATVNASGVAVAAHDELVQVQRLWRDGRYFKPSDLLPI